MKEKGAKASIAVFLASLLVYLLTVAAVSVYSYWNARTAMLKEIDRNLLIGASTVKGILGSDFHDRATNKEAITPAEDRANIAALSRFAEQTGFKFLYTVIRKNGRVFITASSATAEELDAEKEVHYFEPYDEASDELISAFDGDAPVYAAYTDRWGRFRAVIVPERSSTGNRYLSVAEFDIGFVRKALRQKLISSVLIAVVLLAGSLPLFLFFLKREKAYSAALVSANRQLREDIEHRKRMETERAQFQEQLRRSQKLEALGTMAGGIAHDFNNMLSVILGYAELALTGVPGESKVSRQLREVVTAGNRARDLVRRILTFSRQSDQAFQPVRLRRIVSESAKMFRSTFPATIDIQVRLESDAAVLGDPTQIHQVLMNLATNAGHAMKDRNGILEIKLQKVSIDSDALDHGPGPPPGAYVRLTVRDTGRGMPQEVCDRIFDPFFTTKGPGEGTGLGLSVVHGIVKSHGGVIEVFSRPEEGAEFRVFFPAITAPLETLNEPDEPAPGGGETILVIDDEPALLEMEKQTLESLGYRVDAVSSGSEALDRFASDPNRYELVITDMTMPRMTGLELAVRLIEIRPDIPIVLCTGYSARLDEQALETSEIRAILTKPVSREQLARRVREILDAKEPR